MNMKVNPNHILDSIYTSLDDVTAYVINLEERLEQLEAENQNLAEQVLEAEEDAEYFEKQYWALAREKARGETE